MDWTRLTRLDQPAEEPISLDAAKLHLRVDGTDSDAEITAMISAARDAAEKYCQRPWASGQWRVLYPVFPPGTAAIALPFQEVTDIAELSYLDSDRTEVVLADTEYTLDDSRQQLRPVDNWPQQSTGIRLTIDAQSIGNTVPESVLQAMLLLIGDYYENRTAQTIGGQIVENRAAMFLLNQYRDNMGV